MTLPFNKLFYCVSISLYSYINFDMNTRGAGVLTRVPHDRKRYTQCNNILFRETKISNSLNKAKLLRDSLF